MTKFHRAGRVRTDVKRGGVLLAALIPVSLAAILLLGYLQLASATTRRQARATDTKLAFYMAEAGLAEAFSGLKVGRSGNIGSEQEPAYMGHGLFWVEAQRVGERRTQLDSFGMVGSGMVHLSVVAERSEESVSGLGVFSKQSVRLVPGSFIDGYDSSAGEYDVLAFEDLRSLNAGGLSSDGDILVQGSVDDPVVIFGSARPGPGGELIAERPAGPAGIAGHLITGSTHPRLEPVELPPVKVPEVRMSPGVKQASPLPLVLGPGSGGIRFLTVEDAGEVLLQGPMELVIGDLLLKRGAVLSFDIARGPVNVFVTGAAQMEPGASFTFDAEEPGSVSLQFAGQSDDPVKLAANGPFLGYVYAPERELEIGPSFEVMGALIAKGLEFQGAARVHCDQSLARESANAALPRFVSWRIVELSSPQQGLESMDPFRYLGVDMQTLPTPYGAHADQQLHVLYETKLGAISEYDGMESAFDWHLVARVFELARDGQRVTSAHAGLEDPDAESVLISPLIDLINELPPMSSADLLKALIAALPLKDEVLIAAIERLAAMDDADLRAVLEQASPLSEGVLLALLDKTTPLGAAELLAVMQQNYPLSSNVLLEALQASPPVASANLREFLNGSQPLSNGVLNAAIDNSAALSGADLQQVLVSSSPLALSLLLRVIGEVTSLNALQVAAVLAAQ